MNINSLIANALDISETTVKRWRKTPRPDKTDAEPPPMHLLDIWLDGEDETPHSIEIGLDALRRLQARNGRRLRVSPEPAASCGTASSGETVVFDRTLVATATAAGQ